MILAGDSTYARAESLLARHQFAEARALAEQIVREYPNEERAHLLLGRVLLASPTVGRYPALEQFKVAANLAPTDPEPLYLEAMVGFALGGDDGDRLARESLVRLFTLSSNYRDAWFRFRLLYQDKHIRRDADRALAHHPNDPAALVQRAELALDLLSLIHI